MIRRQSTMLVLAVAGLMLAAGTIQAATMDSANFAYKYEADALPAAAEWYTAGTGLSVANGELSYSGDGHLMSALPAIYSPTVADDYTVEARFKVTNLPSVMPGVHFVVGNSDSYGFFTISETAIYLLNAAGGHDPLVWDLDNTGMHTYRIAYSAGADRFSLWRDDSLISDDLIGYTGGGKCIYFGDVAGSTVGAASLDYMRIDTTGAYAPVPEPATLCLLAVGGLAALRRRCK